MGEVYRARDSRLGRDIAIKVLPSAYSADRDRVRRFEQEARAAAALNHPNILAVHDICRERLGDSEILFIVSELLQGQTLREVLARGALPLGKAIEYAKHVVGGVAAAHEKNIVHRDLKPENIFVTTDGLVKILDFGVAKLSEPDSAEAGATARLETAAGIVMGTIGYMSHEQLRGHAVDHRSVLFSFGAVLYEMLAGERAFKGGTGADTINAILSKEPPELDPVGSRVPIPFQRIIQRCLAKAAADRFQSTRDLAFAIATLSDSASSPHGVARPADAGSRSGPEGASTIDPPLAQLTFGLSASVCRKLDRTTLDPRVIGDHIEYADNGIEADTLVCFLHGTGLDHSQFEHLLKSVPYRAVAPTLYGCEPHARRRLVLPVTDHLIILREWLRHLVHQSSVRRIVLVGFSTGSDLCLRFVAPPVHDPTIRVDGLLALDANVSLETCWLTRVLARMTTDNPSQVLDNLRSFGASTPSIGEWLNIHEYLVRVLRKFHGNLDVLANWGAEFAGPFEIGGLAEFGERYRTAARVVPHLRFVVSEQNEANREAVLKVRLMNLDSGFLGEDYSEDSIVIEPDADHFDLLQTSHFIPHLESIVAKLRYVS
jgi:tRNA A-37 threonylcarbamoyl transferase component Bud32/pimeloyl-ACP methyl ester carboxylesterase